VDCHEGGKDHECGVIAEAEEAYMCSTERPAREADGVPPTTELTPAQSVVHRQPAGSPLDGGVEIGKGTGFGMDTGKEPGTSPQRQEMGTVDRTGDHGVEQQMNPEVDALKGEEGQLPLKADMGSSSNLVKRLKMRPRTRRPGGSWIPIQTFVLVQISELPTAPYKTASTQEDGDDERGQCMCKWRKWCCLGGNTSRQ